MQTNPRRYDIAGALIPQRIAQGQHVGAADLSGAGNQHMIGTRRQTQNLTPRRLPIFVSRHQNDEILGFRERIDHQVARRTRRSSPATGRQDVEPRAGLPVDCL